MTKNLAITVDIGTTNAKVTLFDYTTGEIRERASFPTIKIEDKEGELFDHQAIWGQLEAILKSFVVQNKEKIDSITIASVGEAGVLLDQEGVVVTPMIAWYDQRAREYIECLSKQQKETIYRITGLPAHSNYSLGKIKWLMDRIKNKEQGSYLWLNIPDLFAYYLTKRKVTEYSLASRTMCYDIEKKDWSNELLSYFDLDGMIQFPEVISASTIIGYTTDSGLPILSDEKIAIRIAGHDHMVGAFGIELQENELLNSTGTTEGLLQLMKSPANNQENFGKSLSNGVFIDAQMYTIFSSMPTGGSAFAWYQQLFNKSKEQLTSECGQLLNEYLKDKIVPLETGFFIPHLNGSGAPFKNGRSKGMLYGLDLTTQAKDILFALVLGLVLELKLVTECFEHNIADRIVVIGPAINNPLWLQLKADAMNKELKVINIDEAVSFGALRIAYPTFTAKLPSETYQPNPKRASELSQVFEKYQTLYQSKKQITKGKLTS